MSAIGKPLVLSAPDPRSLDLIFTDTARRELHARYDVLECEPSAIAGQSDETLSGETLAAVRYIIGQPSITPETLAAMKSLRCIFNVETNLINNMPYEALFERGIHVVTTGAVFADPVAELGLAMALNLARGRQQHGPVIDRFGNRHCRIRRSRQGSEPAPGRLQCHDPRVRSLAAAFDSA